MALRRSQWFEARRPGVYVDSESGRDRYATCDHILGTIAQMIMRPQHWNAPLCYQHGRSEPLGRHDASDIEVLARDSLRRKSKRKAAKMQGQNRRSPCALASLRPWFEHSRHIPEIVRHDPS